MALLIHTDLIRLPMLTFSRSTTRSFVHSPAIFVLPVTRGTDYCCHPLPAARPRCHPIHPLALSVRPPNALATRAGVPSRVGREGSRLPVVGGYYKSGSEDEGKGEGGDEEG